MPPQSCSVKKNRFGVYMDLIGKQKQLFAAEGDLRSCVSTVVVCLQHKKTRR